MSPEENALASFQVAIDLIDKLDEKELMALNGTIVERLKALQALRKRQHMARFSVGDRVSFPDKQERMRVASILRINRKTVSLLTEDGERWNVAPELVTLVEGTREDLPSPTSTMPFSGSSLAAGGQPGAQGLDPAHPPAAAGDRPLLVLDKFIATWQGLEAGGELSELIFAVQDEYLDSPEGQALDDDAGFPALVMKAAAVSLHRSIISLQAEELEQTLLYLIPRDTIIDSALGDVLVNEVSAFYRFVAREYALSQAGACLAVLNTLAGGPMRVALADRSRYGELKKTLLIGAVAGFDIENQAGVDRWLAHVRQHGLPEGLLDHAIHDLDLPLSPDFDLPRPSSTKSRPPDAKTRKKNRKASRKARKKNR